MKKTIHALTLVLTLCVAFCFGSAAYVSRKIPNSVIKARGETFSVDSKIVTITEIGETTKNVSSQTKGINAFEKQVNLFGIIPIKNVEIQVVDKMYVALGGTPFGMKIFTKGVMVVGMSDVETKDGLVNPAEDAGIKIGDVIKEIDGISVSSNTDVSDIIAGSDGKKLKMKIVRNNRNYTVSFRAAKSCADSCYKAGLWVRDSSAGIGTMTFYLPHSGVFGGLGHAICDVDTGLILPISSGEIVDTEIYSINKSCEGTVGELCGFFKDSTTGSLLKNCEAGVYGELVDYDYDTLTQIASKDTIKVGAAQILTTVDDAGAKYYDCVIESVNYDESDGRGMIIRITDKRLLRKTGGIVQGMSGSPLLQNGKLVGAVTHVLVDDPTRGYAIFAENMLGTAQSVVKQELKEVS